jgi:hypothetical protein
MKYRMWRCLVQVAWTIEGGWRTSDGCPTFYLDEDELGIVNADHAERIAQRVVNPTGLTDIKVHVAVAAPGDWS